MFGFNVILNVSKRLSCIRANPARISNSILNDVLVKIFWPSNLTLNMRQNKYQVNKAFYNDQHIRNFIQKVGQNFCDHDFYGPGRPF